MRQDHVVRLLAPDTFPGPLSDLEYDELMADRRQSVAGSTPAALAPVLGANRDGSATADSSSGLLVTVMGEFVLPGGGAVWTQTLVATMEQLGVQGKATRQALARMEKRAWLKRDRVGRRTRWLLTDAFSDLLAEGAERIYGFGMNPRVWDGRWLVVLASVPERDRNVRYRMGLELNWVGMGSLGQGLWICPWVEHEPAVTDLLQRLGVRASSFRAELGSLGSGPDLVAEAPYAYGYIYMNSRRAWLPAHSACAAIAERAADLLPRVKGK